MNITRVLVAGAATLSLFVSHVAFAQDVSRYRDYVLGSTLESVAAASRLQAADVKTIHERPAKIQELEWRAPYLRALDEPADPVRGIVFTFLDDALYQIVVSYDYDRMDGLTNGDIIETLTTTYGTPVLKQITRPAAAQPDAVALAQWNTTQALLTLVRGTHTSEFQLILIAPDVNLRARTAAREAIRLDAAEAPQREMDQLKKDVAEANEALEKARAANKAAFRP